MIKSFYFIDESKGISTPRVSGSGSFDVLPLWLMLENGSGTDFGTSQCIPMGPYHCRSTLGVGIALELPQMCNG